ncbi:hypothetical protein ACJMK2_044356 [Sinanodonta woodiana]|uniref:Uncharacterized protein n=1 Tax=Sinanodonta woodiana TaxID=1069815 RepID=A0ABD3VZW6_SINWO
MANFEIFRGFQNDRTVRLLTNMDLWKKYIDKMAKASQKFFEETMEIVQDMENDIDDLHIDTSESKFVEDKKVVKEIKEREKEFKEAKKSFSKIAEKLDAKHKKVTRTYRHLQKLRGTNVASENEIAKAQRKLLKARNDFNSTADKEEAKRQNLIHISGRYEIQAKQVTRDKIKCLVSTWKKLFENHARLSFDER